MKNIDSEEFRGLTAFRRHLHSIAEISGHEEQTARLLHETLVGLVPSQLETGLGGHGVAAFFDGAAAGPTVVLRADMDALPINEATGLEYASQNPGVSHKCGYDGHMAIATGIAGRFSRKRPERGRLVVLFQPAEETGQGAAKVIQDSRFADLKPDIAIAIQTFPASSSVK